MAEELPPRIPRLGWAIAFIIGTGLMAMAWISMKDMQPAAVSDLPVVTTVPGFSFVSQEGETVTREDLLGSVWIADFIFTRCPNPCPRMSERMMELQKAIQRKGGNVKLVTVTVDPEFDTPEVLAAYGARYQADPEIWKLLTGDSEEIQEFVVKGMLQPLAAGPEGVSAHSQRFLVVDAAGDLRSFYDLDDPELMQKLLMDIGKLLREFQTTTPANTPS